MKKYVLTALFLAGMLYSTFLRAENPQPQRIITLSPHLTELVFLIDADDRLRGTVEYSNFPPRAAQIPRVGGASGLDVERILSLQPDLILAWQGGTREAEIHKLESLGLRVVRVAGEDLDDIPESLELLGRLLGQQQQAAYEIEQFKLHLKQITQRYHQRPTKRAFIEIAVQPLMGLTGRHPFAAGLQICAIENIFAGVQQPVVLADLETILSRKVDIVLISRTTAETELLDRQGFYSGIGSPRLLVFDDDAALRQTPRLLDAVEQVCREVHDVK